MIIETIHIDHFGAITGFECEPGPGLNIIYGENEAGKSTLAAFICFMLYGVRKQEKNRILPLGGGSAGGWMTLTANGKHYRIERTLSENGKDQLTVIDLAVNKRCPKITVPGETFCGLPDGLFRRTAYISQEEGSRVDGGIAASIENLLFSGDESQNVEKAQRKLDQLRVALLHKNRNGGRIFELQREIARLETEFSEAKQKNADRMTKQNVLERDHAAFAVNQEQRENAKKILDHAENARLLSRFDELMRTDEEYRTAAEAIRMVNTKYERNSYLPSRDYIAELHNLEDNAHSLDEEASQLRSAANQLGNSELNRDERLAFAKKVAARGGRNAILNDYDRHEETRKKYRLIGFLTLILFPLSIWFFLRSGKERMECEKLLSYFGVSDRTSLDDALTTAEKDAAVFRTLAQQVSHLMHQCEEKQAQAAVLYEKIARLTDQWGRDDLRAVYRDAERYFAESEEARCAFAAVDAKRNGILSLTDGFDEASLRAAQEELSHCDAVVNNTLPLERVRFNYDYLDKQNEALDRQIRRLETELAALRVSCADPLPIKQELDQAREELKTREMQYAAVTLAYETLEKSSQSLRESVAPRLSRDAGKLMSALTGGKYPTIGVGIEEDGFSMDYTVAGETSGPSTRDISYMSAGTLDLTYISLRLALIDLLCGTERPAAVFDESFSRLSDDRLEKMLQLISEYCIDGRQVLLLTSQKRDASLCMQLGISFTQIRMPGGTALEKQHPSDTE